MTEVLGPRTPPVLGRYRLQALIAQGGMGSIYLARAVGAQGFERPVAIKTMHPHLAAERKYVEMFLDEAQLLSRLSHPNVCAVMDFGEEGGVPYLVMEHLLGEPLSSLVREPSAVRLPVPLVLRVVSDSARGLHAAHELKGPDGVPFGVVHRDVSPHNVMVLYDGVSKVLDFGIARARGRLTQTATGEVKGRFAYMAPEVARGRAVDRRADVFSLGVVLWEALTRRRLFLRGSEAETVLAVLAGRVPPPSGLERALPPGIDAIVTAALAVDPAVRTPTAEALADALDAEIRAYGEPAGHAEVAACLRAALPERLAEKERLVAGTREATPEGRPQPERAATAVRFGPLPLPSSRLRGWRIASAGALAGAAAVWLALGAPAGVALDGPAARTPPATAAAVEPAEPPRAVPPPAPDSASAEPVTDERGSAAGEPAPSPTPPAPTPRARERDPSPEAAHGFLNILAVPPAEVFEGGRRLGRTPLLRAPLRAGRHHLRLVAGAGTRPTEIVVTIRPGEVTAQSVRLRRR